MRDSRFHLRRGHIRIWRLKAWERGRLKRRFRRLACAIERAVEWKMEIQELSKLTVRDAGRAEGCRTASSGCDDAHRYRRRKEAMKSDVDHQSWPSFRSPLRRKYCSSATPVRCTARCDTVWICSSRCRGTSSSDSTRCCTKCASDSSLLYCSYRSTPGTSPRYVGPLKRGLEQIPQFSSSAGKSISSALRIFIDGRLRP